MTEHTNPQKPVLLITGGAGFVGTAVIHELLHDDAVIHPSEVRIFDRRPPGELPETSAFSIRFIEGDVRDDAALQSACEGVDIVLHLANMVDWGTHPEKDVFDVNVGGTQHVLDACRNHGVKVVVFTSSLDAVFTGKHIRGIDESCPYPDKHIGAYSKSKAAAERVVQAANSEHLKTVVLRPSGIWGEGDPYHLGSLAKMAKTGFFCRIGNGKSRCMHIYVGNVAHAHLKAAAELWKGNTTHAGGIYFLIDDEPMNFFDCLVPVLEKAGLKVRPKNFWLPGWLLTVPALISEGTAFLMRPFKRIHPPLSRFALAYICNDFIITTDKATRDFGFVPRYSREQAVERTAAWFRDHGF